MGVQLLIDHTNVVEFDVEILIDRVQRSGYRQIILQLHSHLFSHQGLEVGVKEHGDFKDSALLHIMPSGRLLNGNQLVHMSSLDLYHATERARTVVHGFCLRVPSFGASWALRATSHKATQGDCEASRETVCTMK